MQKSADLTLAAQFVQRGELILYPTEAVYGIGCAPHDDEAIQTLLAIKQREKSKGVILIAARYEQLLAYIEPLTNEMLARIGNTWPGPNTWIVPARADTSPLLTGGRNTLAVRVTQHPVVRALCEACGHPLVSTSANISGHPEARDIETAASLFQNQVPLLVLGDLGSERKPSTIRDVTTGQVLR